MQILGGLIMLVAVVAVVVLVASGGGKKHPVRMEAPVGRPSEAIASVLRGIPQAGNVLGKPTAPVTLEYFSDLESPTSEEFTLDALPVLIKRWVRAGDLRIEYHSLRTATRSRKTFKKQQGAAYAAGAQNKAWYFIETVYHEQGEEGTGYMTETYIDDIAKQVPGLNLTQWQQARGNEQYAAEVAEDARAAHKEGFGVAPSVLIGRTGGAMRKLEDVSLVEPAPFNAAIERLLST